MQPLCFKPEGWLSLGSFWQTQTLKEGLFGRWLRMGTWNGKKKKVTLGVRVECCWLLLGPGCRVFLHQLSWLTPAPWVSFPAVLTCSSSARLEAQDASASWELSTDDLQDRQRDERPIAPHRDSTESMPLLKFTSIRKY